MRSRKSANARPYRSNKCSSDMRGSSSVTHSIPRSPHHVPRLPGVLYPMSGTHFKLKVAISLSTSSVFCGASTHPIGACIERIDDGLNFSINATSACVSGSIPAIAPGDKSVSRGASKIEREPTFSVEKFCVLKLRFKSTPFAFPRVPRVMPSGLAHKINATESKLSSKARSTRLKRNVVSGSSP